jgi:hypothetical protein
VPLQIGFLYLRYVCDPRNLWNWFKGYVEDKEVGPPGGEGWGPGAGAGRETPNELGTRAAGRPLSARVGGC